MQKFKHHTYSIAVALVALYVGAAGVAKLLGVQAVAQSFTTMGLLPVLVKRAILSTERNGQPSELVRTVVCLVIPALRADF